MTKKLKQEGKKKRMKEKRKEEEKKEGEDRSNTLPGFSEMGKKFSFFHLYTLSSLNNILCS